MRWAHSTALGPLSSVTGHHACDIRPGGSPSIRAEPPSIFQDLDVSSQAAPSNGVPCHPSQPTITISPRTRRSMALIEADSHAIRLELADKVQSRKATKGKYDRYLEAYISWWDANQRQAVRSDMSRVAIPALPVTVAKAVLFLKYESTREKKVRVFILCSIL